MADDDKRKRIVVEEVDEVATPEEQAHEQHLEEVLSEVTTTETVEPVQEVNEPKTSEVTDFTKVEEDPQMEKPKGEVGAPTPPPGTSKKGISPMWIFLPGLMLLIGLVGGIYVYQKGVNEAASSPSPEPVASTAATPTPTPAEELDLTKHKISILNGSGIAGEAGKVETLLEAADFVVSSTGNAKTYDYEETVIQAKKDVSEDFLKELEGVLSKNYTLAKSEVLPESSSSEVIVIVGSTKAN